MANFSSIKEWADDDKPREKMMLKGAAALSDAELLAILIGTGSRSKSAVDLARELLQNVQHNLHQLARSSLKDLQQVKGIGGAKAITIAAALELGRRRQMADSLERASVKGSFDAAQFIIPFLSDLTHEKFFVLYFNHAHKIIHQQFISSGGVAATVVDVKMIFQQALSHLASAIIIAHNHPSGNLQPSKEDIHLTQKIKQAAQTLDIKLLDHIIVAEQRYLSFADEGLL